MKLCFGASPVGTTVTPNSMHWWAFKCTCCSSANTPRRSVASEFLGPDIIFVNTGTD